jgi:RNA polymerase sigma-70 factor, ECF subfamily
MKINDIHDNVISAGDHAAFRLLFDELYKKLCIYVFNFTDDESLSQDIVAEAFVSLWENFYSIRDRSAMKSWLYQVCRNKSLNAIKSVRHRQKKETDFS